MFGIQQPVGCRVKEGSIPAEENHENWATPLRVANTSLRMIRGFLFFCGAFPSDFDHLDVGDCSLANRVLARRSRGTEILADFKQVAGRNDNSGILQRQFHGILNLIRGRTVIRVDCISFVQGIDHL